MTDFESSNRISSAVADRFGFGSIDRTRATSISAIILTIVAAALRILVSSHKPIEIDETQFVWVTRLPTWSDITAFLSDHESHPPLFYAIERMWLRIFGDTESAAIALSIVFGVAAIPTIFAIACRMFSNRIGVICGTLLTFAPIHIYFSVRIRPYSFLSWFYLLSIYFLWRTMNFRRNSDIIAYAISTLAILLTHNWGWIALSGQWAVVISWVGIAYRRGDAWLPGAKRWIVAQSLVAIGYAPWMASFTHQIGHAGYGRTGERVDVPLLLARSILTMTLLDQSRALSVLVVGVVAASIIIALKNRRTTSNRTTSNPSDPLRFDSDFPALPLVVGAPVFAIAAASILSFKTPLYQLHCLSIVGPSLLMGFVATVERNFHQRLRIIGYLIYVVIFVFYAAHDRTQLLRSGLSPDRIAAAAVAAESRSVDLIVIQPQAYATSFFYYYPIDSKHLDYPTEDYRGPIYYDDLSRRLLDEKVFERFKSKLFEARRKNLRVWFVTESHVLDDKATDDELKPDGKYRVYQELFHLRLNQIYRYLCKLYGPPRVVHDPGTSGTAPKSDKNQRIVFLFQVDRSR